MEYSLLSDGQFLPLEGGMRCSCALFYGTPDSGMLIWHISRAAALLSSRHPGSSTEAEFAAALTGLYRMRSEGMLRQGNVTLYTDCMRVADMAAGAVPKKPSQKSRLGTLLRSLCSEYLVKARYYPSGKMKGSIIGH